MPSTLPLTKSSEVLSEVSRYLETHPWPCIECLGGTAARAWQADLLREHWSHAPRIGSDTPVAFRASVRRPASASAWLQGLIYTALLRLFEILGINAPVLTGYRYVSVSSRWYASRGGLSNNVLALGFSTRCGEPSRV